MFRKAGAAMLLMAFMALGSVVPVQARDRDDKCEQRIHKAEENLRKAERKHGANSRQVQKRRHELEEAREKCRRQDVRDRDHDHDRR